MSCLRQIFIKIGTLLLAFLFFSGNILAQDGAAIYKAKCISCHKIDKDATGPALQGARQREAEGGAGADWVYKWVANPAAQNDAYATALKKKYAPTLMNGFNDLTKKDIDAVLDWADKGGDAPKTLATSQAPKEDNSLLYGLITLILAVVAFILLQVNSNLRKLTDEKEGVHRTEPVPFYKNKTYLMAGILVLAFIGGVLMVTGFNGRTKSGGAVGLGRQQGYQPTQPIFYSHKVHAGTNQISCLYCHGSSQDSKTAGIPSVNVCMNCHMAVNKYEGVDKLVREDGTPVDGSQEIAKLYKYAGWNPDTKKYNADANGDGQPDGSSPIPWVKIHNLPDHVYFNHSQHIKVGKQQCQTCHGNIQEMAEVSQFSPLSMGWCVNCHRETKVDFYNPKDGSGNKFYSIYQKYQDQMVDSILDHKGHKMANPHKMDSVTVEQIGGIECQKCHM